MHLPLVRTMDILWIIFVCQVVRCFTVAPAGLCERHRVISQHNNNCGSGCEGLCMICEIHCERNFVSMRNFVNTLHTNVRMCCGILWSHAGIDLLARRKTVHEMQRPNPGHEEMSRHLPRRAGRRDSH